MARTEQQNIIPANQQQETGFQPITGLGEKGGVSVALAILVNEFEGGAFEGRWHGGGGVGISHRGLTARRSWV